MQKTKQFLIILLVFLLGACNMPGSELSPAQKTALIEWSVAETVAARTGASAEPDGSDPVVQTDTPDPGGSTNPPTNTPQPTDPPAPSLTPTASDTPMPCNKAKFITDVTIPDGTEFEPGEAFTKTWRLKNTGSCAWTSGYDIIFSGGDAMNAPSAVQITSGTVNPGQNIDVSVILTAPPDEGTYRGNWQIRDPSNVIFGIENSSSNLFWVEIEVEGDDTPQSATLHKSNRSGSMGPGGRDSLIKLGIAPNGDPIRAFLDFDLDDLPGLTSSSTIQAATLDLSDYSGVGCFEFRGPLKAGVIDYGSNLNYPGEFTKAFTATLFSVPSGLGISGPRNIKNKLQNFVDSNGADHFQFRMELAEDHLGAGFNCMMQWADPTLSVTYIP